jgi:hypothetical protein
MCEVEEKNRRLREENEKLRAAVKEHQDYIKQMLADARAK